MNFILIAFIVFALSAIALALFLKKKAKDLASLEPGQSPHVAIVAKVTDKVEKYNVFQKFVLVRFLEKSLLSLRVWIQKLENKTIHWLEHLRVNYKQQAPNPVFSSDYWDKVKEAAQKKERWHSKKKNEISKPAQTEKIKTESQPPIQATPVETKNEEGKNDATQVSLAVSETEEPINVSSIATPVSEMKPHVSHAAIHSKKKRSKKSKQQQTTAEISQTTNL